MKHAGVSAVVCGCVTLEVDTGNFVFIERIFDKYKYLNKQWRREKEKLYACFVDFDRINREKLEEKMRTIDINGKLTQSENQE